MNNNGGGFYDEPKQQANSQHVIGDSTSRVWLESKDPKPTPDYPAQVSISVSWVAFSSLVFKLVRLLSGVVSLPVLLTVLGFLLLPLAYLAYRSARDEDSRFKALFNSLLIVAGIVIGSF